MPGGRPGRRAPRRSVRYFLQNHRRVRGHRRRRLWRDVPRCGCGSRHSGYHGGAIEQSPDSTGRGCGWCRRDTESPARAAVLPAEPEPHAGQTVLRNDAEPVTASESGLFECRPDIAVGDTVDAGERLGLSTNLLVRATTGRLSDRTRSDILACQGVCRRERGTPRRHRDTAITETYPRSRLRALFQTCVASRSFGEVYKWVRYSTPISTA